MKNGWYLFGDSRETQLKTDYGRAVIVRESLFTKRVIKLYLRPEKITATCNSFWRIKREEVKVEDILSKVISPNQAKYETEGILKKFLNCDSTEELSKKISEGQEIQETVLLDTINALFLSMYVF